MPIGPPPSQRAAEAALITRPLDAILAQHGAGRLVVIIPANAAHDVVAAWAASHGVRTVSFTPGGDDIPRRSYRALSRDVLVRIR